MLYVPNNYNPELKYPLMINFHGFGGYAKDFVNEADMRSLAEDQNFLVVYPQGTLLSGSPHWNSSAPSADNKSSADDLGFVETMIDAISAEYSVESKRIYAAGYSNGGFLTYYLACNSKRFAAIGSVAGTMIDDSYKSCNASVPTAMINIHGTADKTVPMKEMVMEALQFLMLLIGGKTLIVVLMKMLFLINLDQLNNTFLMIMAIHMYNILKFMMVIIIGMIS